MKPLPILNLLIFSFLAAGFTPDARAADKPMNIVFFLVDDLGWTDAGCYGSSFYETPNIDKLAKGGVRFTQAYAACHVCSPTRASILTGKYPARLNLTDWLPGRRDFDFQWLAKVDTNQSLPEAETTLAEELRKHGYQTAIFGKWHLGEEPSGPTKHGFDVQVPKNWNKGWPRSGYHAPFEMEGIDDSEGGYLTDRLTDGALQFIEGNKEKPFFLYFSHFAVHDPIQGRPDLVEKYRTKLEKLKRAEGSEFALEGNPDAAWPLSESRFSALASQEDYQGHKVLPNRMVKIKQHQDNVEFAAMVEAMDQSLGRLTAKLDELGLSENTIVIFFSDNGGMSAANFGNPDRLIQKDQLDGAYSTSNLPLRGGKGWLYEGGIRVPLIVKWPSNGKAGTTSDLPVISTDFFPSILEMAGLPAAPKQAVDGISLAKAVKGEKQERGPIFWHFPHYSNHGMQSPGGAVRAGDYKLLEYFERGSVQLFNLKDDPGEQKNLADDMPDKVAEMRGMLNSWRQAVGAKMPVAKKDFDPNKPDSPQPDPDFNRLRAENLVPADSVSSLELLAKTLANTSDPGTHIALMRGMVQGLGGQRNVNPPESWSKAIASLAKSDNGEVRKLTQQLSQIFGDKAATQWALATVRNTSASIGDRRDALKSLVSQRNSEVLPALRELVSDPNLQMDAIRAYATIEDKDAPAILLGKFNEFPDASRRAIIETLLTRKSYAEVLLSALKEKTVPKDAIPAYAARSLSSLLGKAFTDVYGDIEALSKDKEELIAKYKSLLTPDRLAKADPKKGRLIFQSACAACHVMYGEGGEIGPDITGSNRADINYILLNMIDPSADIPDAYKLITITTKDERVLAGTLAEEDDQRVVLRMVGQTSNILKSDIAKREVSPGSMMPEGLLPTLPDEQVVDLVKYLQTTQQVELPK